MSRTKTIFCGVMSLPSPRGVEMPFNAMELTGQVGWLRLHVDRLPFERLILSAKPRERAIIKGSGVDTTRSSPRKGSEHFGTPKSYTKGLTFLAAPLHRVLLHIVCPNTCYTTQCPRENSVGRLEHLLWPSIGSNCAT